MKTENFPDNVERIVYDKEEREIRVYTDQEEHIYEWEHGTPIRQK